MNNQNARSCDAGQYAAAGNTATSCSVCNPGEIAKNKMTACEACETGKYQDEAK